MSRVFKMGKIIDKKKPGNRTFFFSVDSVIWMHFTKPNGNSNRKRINSFFQSPEQAEWWSQDLDLDMCNLTLIGFSKGCVVLNQFIYEFHYLKTLTPDNEILSRFVDRITDMYWLDGGHPGHKNTWITSRCLLETLSRLGELNVSHAGTIARRENRRHVTSATSING